MNLEIVPFRKELLENFIYDGIEQEITGKQILPIAEFYSRLGSVYLGLVNNKVIALGGVFPLWNNSGGCFLFMNKEATKYKKSIFKILLTYINTLLEQYKIKILTVECIDMNLEAHRLIEHLGFHRDMEIKMARYIKGE